MCCMKDETHTAAHKLLNMQEIHAATETCCHQVKKVNCDCTYCRIQEEALTEALGLILAGYRLHVHVG